VLVLCTLQKNHSHAVQLCG